MLYPVVFVLVLFHTILTAILYLPNLYASEKRLV